ncbi:hypothetical protein PHYPSEUDO_013676 [Phytophthora pseudosyringae]|uniref:Uncharacterized protein n=1 Tax=Phytophthora pseudosyringae TaxID=221518 RepID=A0A8T1W2E0_9STRA|nr:hypothetical protein PHYPSEUDO_013676 [Phytophthora pseudosyringae]
MESIHEREQKRARLSAPDDDPWSFLTPWCEQLRGRLVVVPGGYLSVLHPGARRFRRGQDRDEETQVKQYEASHWRTREALELLVLVHHVNNRAWPKLLLEKCALRFNDALFDANNDDEEEEEDEEEQEQEDETRTRREPPTETLANFTLECEHDREIPMQPKFEFELSVVVGSEKLGEPSEVDKWTKFLLPHASDHTPSAEFIEAKRRIWMTQDEELQTIRRGFQPEEVPVSLRVWASRGVQAGLVPEHLPQLRGLIEGTQSCSQQETAVARAADSADTITYSVQLLSLDISGVNTTELCVKSALGVLARGVAIGSLQLNVYHKCQGAGHHVSRDALAKLFNGVLIGPLDLSQPRVMSIDTLDITCDSSTPWHCEALCSTLAAARTPVANLKINGGFGEWKQWTVLASQLKLLTQALFFPPSITNGTYPSIRGLDISNSDLTTVDLEDLGAEIFTDTPILVPFDINTPSFLSHGGSGDNGLVEVVLSGYGKCYVPRENVLADNDGLDDQGGEPVTSLAIYFSAGAGALEVLLNQIGWQLRNLSLQYFCDMDDDAMMTAILKACPRLMSLSIHPCDIDLNWFISAYERFGTTDGAIKPKISSLTLIKVSGIGTDHGVLFAQRLGDPSSHLAQHLRELTIMTGEESEAFNSSSMKALWVALKNNTRLVKLELIIQPDALSPWKKRFRLFHRQVLPPESLELVSKLAFLSIVRLAASHGGKASPAVQKLDHRPLSLIFELAATRVIRSVTMFYRI